ncbi:MULTISPECIES: DUF2195 family protein [Brucella]|nr:MULTISPECIES: DUF2195 family protein [Brucella]EPZ76510.1 3-phenylpropionate/cinnamic acid dioxygenase ferredoxin subunit [Brucella melitensis ADMAS-G1]EXU82446.1 3-phenylpropionate/cinnamic acid dioxygenase ferredoxin subunit [Brucella melitensis 548]ADZ67407.1 conserved hypothetical protein [Brucella melitensis M28]AIJ87559.1 hypothetical protein DK62_2096 [Brucella melitensis bv. 3 str. Ether]AIJ88142.1 hypothetical protein DK63_2180 [Brucella melitensis bv. 1 str. 16M]
MLAACGKPMNIMALISILHLSSGGVALAADTGRIIIRNDLAACVDMRVEKPPFEYSNGSNIVAINANFKLRKPIGACGCMSALARYASSVNERESRLFLQQGLFNLKKSDTKTLPLATEPALVKDGNIEITVGCARPR